MGGLGTEARSIKVNPRIVEEVTRLAMEAMPELNEKLERMEVKGMVLPKADPSGWLVIEEMN